MKYGQKIKDQYHQVHTIKNELGRGGQGIVFRTEDPDIAVKLVLQNDGEIFQDENYIKRYQKNIDNLLTLPIGEKVHLARPICKLEKHAGYVMQLLRDMQPAESFFSKPPSIFNGITFPDWLSQLVKQEKYQEAYRLDHYAKTGSTKRRLEVLMQCANQLAKLHGQGLVYGDISPENIFYSTNKEFNHVWFIDADNLRFDNPQAKSAVYTPGYGAPEMVLGQASASCNTDCYSLSVLAFKLLSLLHPYEGACITDAEDDWANEDASSMSAEDKARAGLFPYIDDPEDDSNFNHSGLPRSLVLTEKLQHLFYLVFGQARTASSKRPSIFHWPAALAEAVDSSLECKKCSMSFYESYLIEHGTCPYCQSTKHQYLSIQRKPYNDNPAFNNSWNAAISCSNGNIKLPSRLFIPFASETFDEEFARIVKKNEKWFFSLSYDHSVEINIARNIPGEKFSPFVSQIILNDDELKQGIVLQTGGQSSQEILIKLQGGV